jgi:hypothetical protein
MGGIEKGKGVRSEGEDYGLEMGCLEGGIQASPCRR